MQDLSKEMRFQTARSGGKGGQHVNKVETMVEGYWKPEETLLFTEEQIARIRHTLAHKMNDEGEIMLRCRETRSQAENKAIVIKKMNALIQKALVKKKVRKATSPTKESKEKRLESKKIKSQVKEGRKKIRE